MEAWKLHFDATISSAKFSYAKIYCVLYYVVCRHSERRQAPLQTSFDKFDDKFSIEYREEQGKDRDRDRQLEDTHRPLAITKPNQTYPNQLFVMTECVGWHKVCFCILHHAVKFLYWFRIILLLSCHCPDNAEEWWRLRHKHQQRSKLSRLIHLNNYRIECNKPWPIRDPHHSDISLS